MKREVLSALAGGLIGAIGMSMLIKRPTVAKLIDEADAGRLTPEEFITKLYQAYWGVKPDEEGLNYWKSRLEDPDDPELSTNYFSGSHVPITESGRRAAILAVLILRAGV